MLFLTKNSYLWRLLKIKYVKITNNKYQSLNHKTL